jgi:fructokinase
MNVYGGIEAGGTKFVCAVGSHPDYILNQISFKTTTPRETLKRVIDFFKKYLKKHQLQSIGIGSFGPLDLNRESPTYGYITATPKQNWQNVDILGKIKNAFNIPVAIDTDVNTAALGEYTWGAAKGLYNFIYLTIGTGIGGGCLINGHPVEGISHPEMGHIAIPHDRDLDPFPGICPFHQDCFEGLASGPAIKERWGIAAENLAENHDAWKLEANYIAFALVNYTYILSPNRIILGGGVMNNAQLLPLIHPRVIDLLGEYIPSEDLRRQIQSYIVQPKLQNKAGVLGAIALAQKIDKEKI